MVSLVFYSLCFPFFWPGPPLPPIYLFKSLNPRFQASCLKIFAIGSGLASGALKSLAGHGWFAPKIPCTPCCLFHTALMICPRLRLQPPSSDFSLKDTPSAARSSGDAVQHPLPLTQVLASPLPGWGLPSFTGTAFPLGLAQRIFPDQVHMLAHC